MEMTKTVLVMLVLAGSVAQAMPADGMYYGAKPEPANDFDGEGAIECPGTVKIAGNTMVFEVDALNGAHPIPYGAWKLPLDHDGTFHGSYNIPRRPKLDHEIEYDNPERVALYRDLRTVRIDVDRFDVGGGGTGLIIEITLPKAKGADSVEHCRRSLLHIPLPKPGKTHAPGDGAYWARTGGGTGELLHCPSDIIIANGKVYMGVPSRYTSWAVTDLPVKGGIFEADAAFAKLPPPDVMKRAGYYDDDIKQLRGGMSFHLKGTLSGITAAKSNKKSTAIDLEVTSKETGDACNASYLMRGFELGDGFVDCDRLPASELSRHPVCN